MTLKKRVNLLQWKGKKRVNLLQKACKSITMEKFFIQSLQKVKS